MAHRKRTVNVRFVIQGLFLALSLTGVMLLGWLWLHGFRPAEPIPRPPALLAPRGEWPVGARGFQEWMSFRGELDSLAGSGFLLALDDGRTVGVTTAHSLGVLGDGTSRLEAVRFKLPGQVSAIACFTRLHGRPGVARTGADLTVDYVLLQPEGYVDARWVLRPDDRGAPQPGERVALLSGSRSLDGVVQSVDEQAVWVTMDSLFNPALMSGSPFVSRHTGRVVGMLIAGAVRGPLPTRLILGAHPIGSIVERAVSAEGFPLIADYIR